MNFFLETRALPTDAWSRLSRSYEDALAVKIAARLAATGLEVRILDETDAQIFQWRKPMGFALKAQQYRASSPETGLPDLSTFPESGTQKAKGAAA